MDASFFDSTLSHTRRSDASEKREENSVSFFGRFRLWTSFESSPVSFKHYFDEKYHFIKLSISYIVPPKIAGNTTNPARKCYIQNFIVVSDRT